MCAGTPPVAALPCLPLFSAELSSSPCPAISSSLLHPTMAGAVYATEHTHQAWNRWRDTTKEIFDGSKWENKKNKMLSCGCGGGRAKGRMVTGGRIGEGPNGNSLLPWCLPLTHFALRVVVMPLPTLPPAWPAGVR